MIKILIDYNHRSDESLQNHPHQCHCSQWTIKTHAELICVHGMITTCARVRGTNHETGSSFIARVTSILEPVWTASSVYHTITQFSVASRHSSRLCWLCGRIARTCRRAPSWRTNSCEPSENGRWARARIGSAWLCWTCSGCCAAWKHNGLITSLVVWQTLCAQCSKHPVIMFINYKALDFLQLNCKFPSKTANYDSYLDIMQNTTKSRQHLNELAQWWENTFWWDASLTSFIT